MQLHPVALLLFAFVGVSSAITCTETNMEDLLAEHSTAASCWTVFSKNNRQVIYDLTRLVSRHEGGRAVVERLCGVDGTISFYCNHNDGDLRESIGDGDVTKVCDVQSARRSYVTSVEMHENESNDAGLRSGSDSDSVNMCLTPGSLPSSGAARVAATEIEEHSTADDCWTVVDGIAFDITKYVHLHPGGAPSVQTMCGRDGTQMFLAQKEHTYHFMSKGVTAGWIVVLGALDGEFSQPEPVECAADEFPEGTALVEAEILSTHSSMQDCWMVLGCGVYDVSAYPHPGGNSLVEAWCGKDATAAFQAKHPMSYVADMLKEGGTLVGRVSASLVTAEPTHTIALSELATHSAPSDCWSCVVDRVYDLTFVHESHEGGSEFVTSMCGGDGTLVLLRAHQLHVLAGIPIMGRCEVRKEAAYTQENLLDGIAFALYVLLPFLLVALVHLFGVRTQDMLLRRPLGHPRSGAWGDFINGYLEMPLGLAMLLVLYLVITAVLWYVWARHYAEFYPEKYGLPGSAGRMSVYHIALASYMGTRRFTWSWWLLRLPYERALKTHHVVGYVAVVLALIHGLAYLVAFNWKVPGTVSSSAIPILVGLCVLAPFTASAVRVRFYSIFRLTHFAAPVVILLACLHVYSLNAAGKLPRGYLVTLGWVGSAALFWLCDFALTCVDAAARSATIEGEPALLAASGGDASYLVVVCRKRTTVQPGRWMSVACPAAKTVLSHPFTAIVRKTGEGGGEAELEFVWKVNPGSWTHSVAALVQGGMKPPLVVTGPFGGGLGSLNGLPVDKRAMVFVVGGVGVTPAASMMSLFTDSAAAHTHVIWSFRSMPLFEHSRRHFLHLPQENCHFHLTTKGDPARMGAGVRDGRPDIDSLLGVIRARGEAVGRTEVGVFVCGPRAMVADVLRATRELNCEGSKGYFHVHCESFQM